MFTSVRTRKHSSLQGTHKLHIDGMAVPHGQCQGHSSLLAFGGRGRETFLVEEKNKSSKNPF